MLKSSEVAEVLKQSGVYIKIYITAKGGVQVYVKNPDKTYAGIGECGLDALDNLDDVVMSAIEDALVDIGIELGGRDANTT